MTKPIMIHVRNFGSPGLFLRHVVPRVAIRKGVSIFPVFLSGVFGRGKANADINQTINKSFDGFPINIGKCDT